jgi:hypothetical protein
MSCTQYSCIAFAGTHGWLQNVTADDHTDSSLCALRFFKIHQHGEGVRRHI